MKSKSQSAENSGEKSPWAAQVQTTRGPSAGKRAPPVAGARLALATSKFSFAEALGGGAGNSRSSEKLGRSESPAQRPFNLENNLFSRAFDNKMETLEVPQPRPREQSAPKFFMISRNSGKTGSRLTQELLPSFTFGSRGVVLGEDLSASGLSAERESTAPCDSLDTLANIFYQNSVKGSSRKWTFRQRPKKLSFRKQLEKKIFTTKKKVIFKKLLSKKFGVDARAQQKAFPRPLQSVREAPADLENRDKPDWSVEAAPNSGSVQRSQSPLRVGFLNTSLQPLKKNRARRHKRGEPGKFDLGSKFSLNSSRNRKINNMIHGLNMSKIPADFIDYSCLTSPLNAPTFGSASPKSGRSGVRENSLNFSFNPHFKSNLDTAYSISHAGDAEPCGAQPRLEDAAKTSIFETRVLSSKQLAGEGDFPAQFPRKSRTEGSLPEESLSGKFTINFGILN